MAKFYKTKIKEYPGGSKVLTVYKNALCVDDSIDSENVSYSSPEEKTQEEKELEKLRNLWKVKTKIKDYCLSNDFTHFWNLTFDRKVIGDRYDDGRCFKALSDWLRNCRLKSKRRGLKFGYIFIPERHKDGALHFHGLTFGYSDTLVNSGVKRQGKTVFNCPSWNYGFSDVTLIRDKKKTSNYVTKYITKDLAEQGLGKGKKKYWSSRGLRLPAVEYSSLDLGAGLEPDHENDICLIYNINPSEL